MNPLAIARSLFAAAALAVATAPAQQPRPRFTLPDPPYDYTTVDVPKGLECFVFRGSDDPAERHAINRRAALGRVLFHDPLLSKNRSISCASCHEQRRAFADGRAKSTGFRGGKTKRNAMSIVDLAANREGFFWDTREKSLERMVLMPIQDPVEMGLDCGELRARLRAEPGYVDLFRAAFGNDRLETDHVAAALAEFVRSITSRWSRYDEGVAAAKQDVRADFANFTAAENRGKLLFFGDRGAGKRSCAACHMGSQPTSYPDHFVPYPTEFRSEGCRNNGVDDGRGNDDPGLAAVTGKVADRGRFRAPSLRNVGLTAPYMHDGRFATLDDVVAFYAGRVQAHPQLDPVLAPGARGGWGSSQGSGRPLPSHAAPIVGEAPGFPMSKQEQADLVAFLQTLTDWQLARDPRFSDPFAKARGR